MRTARRNRRRQQREPRGGTCHHGKLSDRGKIRQKRFSFVLLHASVNKQGYCFKVRRTVCRLRGCSFLQTIFYKNTRKNGSKHLPNPTHVWYNTIAIARGSNSFQNLPSWSSGSGAPLNERKRVQTAKQHER